MSLYDQFHSDINKKFMYDMIKNIIQKEMNIDISLEPENYNHFISSLPKIFNDNNVDEIEEINKILLDYNIEYFANKLKKTEPIIKDEFERLLQEREKQDVLTGVTSSTPRSDDNVSIDIQEVNTNINTNTNTNTDSNSIDLLINSLNHNEEEKKIVEKQDDEMKLFHINSSKRTNINSSRYNYRIDLHKNNLSTNDLNIVSKLIIPIEDNYLFSIPVLLLSIPELNCNIHMQQEEVIHGNNRKYGVYKSIENHMLSNEKTDRITIDIRDISEKKYNVSDILKVNIIEFKNKKIYFTCSLIHKLDYQVSDYIKIINNNSHNSFYTIFQEPLKIRKIQDNVLICEYRGLEEIDSRILTNIDMKIMNMSNQNILYFN